MIRAYGEYYEDGVLKKGVKLVPENRIYQPFQFYGEKAGWCTTNPKIIEKFLNRPEPPKIKFEKPQGELDLIQIFYTQLILRLSTEEAAELDDEPLAFNSSIINFLD
jgi:hypothetical protein